MPKIYGKRTDKNQNSIVKSLEQIPGVSVEIDHDDLLVGYHGKTFWIEVKNEQCRSKKTGEILESKKRPDQIRLDETWTGHRAYATSFEDVLRILGLAHWINPIEKKGDV